MTDVWKKELNGKNLFLVKKQFFNLENYTIPCIFAPVL